MVDAPASDADALGSASGGKAFCASSTSPPKTQPFPNIVAFDQQALVSAALQENYNEPLNQDLVQGPEEGLTKWI